jgi:hypothetical protein
VATFPMLKTGAVAQYGSSRTRRFSTQVFRFLDGTEQRFQEYGSPLRRWTIRLSLLDEGELAALGAFFETQGGRAGTFAFPDPWDGTMYGNCSFDNDQFEAQLAGQARGMASVTVKENR